jgi:uncharacterized protein YkwD
MRIITLFVLVSCTTFISAQPSDDAIYRVLGEINQLRSQGCKCGDRYMRPVPPVQWNNELYKVSNRYARYMKEYNHFDHVSKSGEDLGDRLNHAGYSWLKIGENLGFGYDDFYSVFAAWKKSPSHCTMLMDPDMTDMGISKHHTYWVQSFSKSPEPLASLSAY